jgi:uncharacterized membrane protein
MTTHSICPSSENIEIPCINQVTWNEPIVWLKAGWDDFRVLWSSSLAYGAIFAMLGFDMVYVAWSHEYLAMTLTTGFLLVAPFLSLVFLDGSHRREQPGLEAFTSLRENLSSIGLFAVLLMFTLSAWERITAILVGLHLGTSPVPNASLTWLFAPANLSFVIAFTFVGAVLAVLVFAISVVTLPMLMDRRVDVVTAVVTSLWVVRENPLPMLVWAMVIVALTALGIATSFIGLALIFPVLGHTTWHAYRALVAR